MRDSWGFLDTSRGTWKSRFNLKAASSDVMVKEAILGIGDVHPLSLGWYPRHPSRIHLAAPAVRISLALRMRFQCCV